MEADPASLVTISASGVVAIALANTVLVLLSTVLSQVFAPQAAMIWPKCWKTIWRTSVGIRS
jgi:hypothetical protein